MNEHLQSLLRETLQIPTHQPLQLQEAHGGDICQSFLVMNEDGRQLFVKTGKANYGTLFKAEKKGLQALAQCDQVNLRLSRKGP